MKVKNTYQQNKPLKILISGGGTGGHLYPALAIAKLIREKDHNAQILFVGANGKIEMEKVPEAGFEIIGLPVRGLDRLRMIKNISFPFRLSVALIKSFKIVKKLKPDIAIGTGGYASAPVLYIAARFFKIPVLLQEQNFFPGLVNRFMSKYAKKICVAYKGMEKFLPAEKIIFSGNPVRKEVTQYLNKKTDAVAYFGLKSGKKVLLIMGGSGGAHSINMAVLNNIKSLNSDQVQLIWQTGKNYYEKINENLSTEIKESIKVFPFIDDMPKAYAAADLVIARAGAITISELCMCGKPAILVPSPNVAGDHQNKNAEALESVNAAVLVKDHKAMETLVSEAMELINNDSKLAELSHNILKMAQADATEIIVNEIFEIIRS